MRVSAVAFLTVALALPAGCAGGPSAPSTQGCALSDWALHGEKDGAAGRSPDAFESRAAACARRGYSADRAAWQAGYVRGLGAHCAPQKGFVLALNGRDLPAGCAALADSPFARSAQDGDALRVALKEYRAVAFGPDGFERITADLKRKRNQAEAHATNPFYAPEDQKAFQDLLARIDRRLEKHLASRDTFDETYTARRATAKALLEEARLRYPGVELPELGAIQPPLEPEALPPTDDDQ